METIIIGGDIAMPSPDHNPSDHPSLHTPKSSSPSTFFAMFFKEWKELGPGNLWFWLIPLMIICGVVGIFR